MGIGYAEVVHVFLCTMPTAHPTFDLQDWIEKPQGHGQVWPDGKVPGFSQKRRIPFPTPTGMMGRGVLEKT